jgi:hypothetical protein
MFPLNKYCRSTVDKQCSITFAVVAQALAVYQSRLEIDKENSYPTPNNIAGACMKHKKSLASSSPAVFVNSISSRIAHLANKCVAAKSTPSPAVSGTACCKCACCEELKARVIYKLDCYHCEGSFKSRPHCVSTYFTGIVSCHELCGSNIFPKCHFKNIVGEDHHNQCTGCGQHTCTLCVQKKQLCDLF